jgi:hypothetical protein
MKPRNLALWAVALFGTAAVLPQSGTGGPVGYWKFDEDSGPAADSAGSANASWKGSPSTETSGLPGFSYPNPRAIVFDQSGGVEDYVEIPNTTALENLQEGDYTISVWFRPDRLPSTPDPDGVSRAGIVIKTGWHTGLHYNSNEQFLFENWSADSNGDNDPDVWMGTWTSRRFPVGSWYHLCGVWNRTQGTAQIWVNGALEGSQTYTAGVSMFEYGTTTWKVGIARPGAVNYRWAAVGAVDDLRFFNRALSENEIGELYNGLPAPRSLTATASGNQVNLSWSAPTGSLSYQYLVWRATSSGGPYEQIGAPTSGTSYTDTVPAAGTYYYVITAVSSVGESGRSNEANATAGSGGGTPPPGPSPSGDDSNDDGHGTCGCGSVRARVGSPWIALAGAAAVLGAVGRLVFVRS